MTLTVFAGRSGTALRVIFRLIIITTLTSGSAIGKTSLPTLRWAERSSGCTFTRGNDGKYYYGISMNDLQITMAVDSQELELVKRRLERVFAIELKVLYNGSATLDIMPNKISLEFVKHSGVVHPSLDPDNLFTRLQNETVEFVDETEQEIRNHPGERADKEAILQTYRNDVAQMQVFLVRRSLHRVKLDSHNPKIEGWIFFSSEGKGIGKWKRPEQFLLRIPLKKYNVEFPFTLPAKEGDLILRHREPR